MAAAAKVKYFAAGLDRIGTAVLRDENGVQLPNQIQITAQQYADAINYLINGQHVCVVNGVFVLDYQLPPETEVTEETNVD